MLTIYCALYEEARALIHSLGLKKETTMTHFQVFSEETGFFRLVITGTGAIAAAAAVAELSAVYPPKETDLLLNFGVCGARSTIAPGELFLCHKLVEESSGRTFYPDMFYPHPFREAELVSVARVLTNQQMRETYSSEVDEKEGIDRAPWLFDMEGAAVYQAGNYSYGPHQMFFLKMVSDHGAGDGEPEVPIKEILKDKEAEVLQYVRFLGEVSREQEKNRFQKETCRQQVEKEAKVLGEELQASVAMREQLQQLLWYWKLTGVDNQGMVAELRRQGRLPAKDKREGKKILEEWKGRGF